MTDMESPEVFLLLWQETVQAPEVQLECWPWLEEVCPDEMELNTFLNRLNEKEVANFSIFWPASDSIT